MPITNDKALQKAIREAERPSYVTVDRGLLLQVSKSGSTSWILRYKSAGKRREMGLGSYPAVSMADAKRRATELRLQRDNGIDPIEHRRRERAAEAGLQTFQQAAEAYIAAHREGWRNAKHAAQWKTTLATYVYPRIGQKVAIEIGTLDVLDVLRPIWTKTPETASRIRSRIELVLDSAAALSGTERANPARWRGHLDKLLPKRSKVAAVRHHPALPWRDLPNFFGKINGAEDTLSRLLQFVILTAARTGEARLATWQEIDFEALTWTVPASRMKARREHVVPLPDAVVEILRAQEGQHPVLIFPGGTRRKRPGVRGPFTDMALLMRLRRLRPGITTHGFRSCFRDWAAESTHHPREVCEQALAHVLESPVEAAYRRGDLLEKRRALMADWAAFAATKPIPNVIEFPTPGVRGG